jgi:hypothetical protein
MKRPRPFMKVGLAVARGEGVTLTPQEAKKLMANDRFYSDAVDEITLSEIDALGVSIVTMREWKKLAKTS